VGFEEPGQETREVGEIIETIRNAALESFWPALARNYVGIQIRHEKNGELVSEINIDPASNKAYAELTALLQDYHAGKLEEKERLEQIGETSLVRVPIEVPKRLSDAAHPELTAHVDLLVKLIDERDELKPVSDNIYRFRRPGMIVRHSGGKSLSISARPYVAALLCGRASGDDENARKVEQFLRAAEPPEHDRWAPDTRSIKDNYQSYGVKAKLKRFEDEVLSAVRKLVSLPEKKGGELPKELLKHLRFGESSGGGNPRFLTSSINAAVSNGTWQFTVKCRRTRPDDEPWHVVVRLRYAVDGGSADDVRAITTIASDEASLAEIRKGDAYLEFPPEVQTAKITGGTSMDSLPAVGTRAAVQIRVDGEKGGLSHV
jgi:RNA polymerase primary sigma factor